MSDAAHSLSMPDNDRLARIEEKLDGLSNALNALTIAFTELKVRSEVVGKLETSVAALAGKVEELQRWKAWVLGAAAAGGGLAGFAAHVLAGYVRQ